MDFIVNNNIDFVINQSGNFAESRLWVMGRSDKTKIISVLHSEPWMAYQHLWDDYVVLRNNSFIEWGRLFARALCFPVIKRKYRRTRVRHFEMLLPMTDKVCMLTERHYRQLSEICPGFTYKYCSVPNPNTYMSQQIPQYEEIFKKIKLLSLPGSHEKKEWIELYRYGKKLGKRVRIGN